MSTEKRVTSNEAGTVAQNVQKTEQRCFTVCGNAGRLEHSGKRKELFQKESHSPFFVVPISRET